MRRTRVGLRGMGRRSFGLLLGMLLVTAPAVVLAGHQFPDVPTGHPFHNEISAIAKAGITAGFSDGRFHPKEPVTRQAMAAFMERGFGRVGWAAFGPPLTTWVEVEAGYSSSLYDEPVREIGVPVPGANNTSSPNQFVHLTGRVTLVAEMDSGDGVNSGDGCPCEFQAEIVQYSRGTVGTQRQTFVSPVPTRTGAFSWSFDVEALVAAPPGLSSFQLTVKLSSRATTTEAARFGISPLSSLTAMTFPFGPT